MVEHEEERRDATIMLLPPLDFDSSEKKKKRKKKRKNGAEKFGEFEKKNRILFGLILSACIFRWLVRGEIVGRALCPSGSSKRN